MRSRLDGVSRVGAARLSAVFIALLPSGVLASEAPASLTADLAGDGTPVTAEAEAGRSTIRLTIRSKEGKRLARADAPSPGGRVAEVALRGGDLGSAGMLVEVSASSADRICRTVWRYRGGTLARLPIRDGDRDVPDCEALGDWSARWEKSGDAPARYVRERTTRTSRGELRDTRPFAFAGFRLERDAAASVTAIDGVRIPAWYDAELYPKARLESLLQRFDLAALRKGTRLKIVADRDKGIFELRFRELGAERVLRVTASKPAEGAADFELSAGDPGATAAAVATVRIKLLRKSIPQDVVVRGAGASLDGSYAPVIHYAPDRIQVYPDAEHELAESLPGTWASEKDERLPVAASPGPAALRFGSDEVALRLDGAPDGADLLLVPRGGEAPSWALALRGPNAIARIRVRCDRASPPGGCRIEGSPEVFRRVGGQLNVR